MFDLIGTALTGGATGIFGSVLGKAFGFVDNWMEEKKAAKDHARTLDMLRLQAEIGEREGERELAITQAQAASDIRVASYQHDSALGASSRWVVDLLRLVRPFLTFSLIVLMGMIYFSDPIGKNIIEASVVYAGSTAILWWFGDRAMRPKK
jgi:hypothetical protein